MMLRVLLAAFATVTLLAGCATHQNGSATLKDLFAYREVLKQQFETSCGAASLATLLHFYFNEPTTESEILKLAAPSGGAPARGLSTIQ